MYDKEDLITENVFVNKDYKTHSQYTELYMTMEGFQRDDKPGMVIRKVAEGFKKYQNEKNLEK